MADLCLHPTTLLLRLFVIITTSLSLHVQARLTVTSLQEPIRLVECRYPHKDLLVLTLKETGNTSSVKTVDNKKACMGDMMLSACVFNETTVTVTAIIMDTGLEELRTFECKATLLVKSESTEINVGHINITVGGPPTSLYTTTGPKGQQTFGVSGNKLDEDLKEACVSRDAPRPVIIVLVLLLVVFMIIIVVFVIKLYRGTNMSCPCHVTSLCAGVTTSHLQGAENDLNTEHLENSTARYHSYRGPPPATPAPRAPGKTHVMDYQDPLDLSAANTSQPAAGTSEELCQYQTPWGQDHKVFHPLQ